MKHEFQYFMLVWERDERRVERVFHMTSQTHGQTGE